MANKILYLKIYPIDYKVLTEIMISSFNEDTAMHTDLKEDEDLYFKEKIYVLMVLNLIFLKKQDKL
jgi:hypothetical protein